jgi:hypothetical protein
MTAPSRIPLPRGTKVIARYAFGDRTIGGSVVRPYHHDMPDWYLVRFDDGTRGGVHRDMLTVRNAP